MAFHTQQGIHDNLFEGELFEDPRTIRVSQEEDETDGDNSMKCRLCRPIEKKTKLLGGISSRISKPQQLETRFELEFTGKKSLYLMIYRGI